MPADQTAAEKLARFAATFDSLDLPDEVDLAARRHLADTLGCAIAAAADPEADAVNYCREYARRGSARPEATILGTAEKTDLRSAALSNCTMARFIDANDMYMSRPGRDAGHFSDMIPALLATAEVTGASGRALLNAIIIGYETAAILCESNHWNRSGFHSVSVATTGTALGAGYLLGLDETQLTNAATLAITSGLMLQSWLKPAAGMPSIKGAAAGYTGERGIMCAELAKMGLTGPPDAIESQYEWFPLDVDMEPFDWPGRRWTMHRNAIKPVPAQIFTQATVQGAEQFYSEGLRLDDMATLTVRSHEGCCGRVQGSPQAFKPETREAADHSTPFVIAMTLRDGFLAPTSYHGNPWLDESLRKAMSRIELVIDPEWNRRLQEEGLRGAEMSATDRAGREYQTEVRQFAGHPDNPLSNEQLVAKLALLVDDPAIQGDGAGQRLLDLCLAIGEQPDVEGIIAAFRLG